MAIESHTERAKIIRRPKVVFVHSSQLPYYTIEFDRTASVTVDVRAGVLSEILRNGIKEVWGLTNLPQAIWDLTTLSFVLDWF